MFLRVKSYKNDDGSFRHYLVLVKNKRVRGRPRQVIVAHIGRIENAEKTISEIINSLSKFRKKLKGIKKN